MKIENTETLKWRRYLSIDEVAIYSGICRTDIKTAIRKGILKYTNPGNVINGKRGKKKIDRYEIDRFMKRSEVETTEV